QKYAAGANWYPSIWLNLSAQYYYKLDHYDEDVFSGEFPRLQNQDWNVNDVNVRITFRPKIPACLGTISLTSRYDFMYTTIDSQEHTSELQSPCNLVCRLLLEKKKRKT